MCLLQLHRLGEACARPSALAIAWHCHNGKHASSRALPHASIQLGFILSPCVHHPLCLLWCSSPFTRPATHTLSPMSGPSIHRTPSGGSSPPIALLSPHHVPITARPMTLVPAPHPLRPRPRPSASSLLTTPLALPHTATHSSHSLPSLPSPLAPHLPAVPGLSRQHGRLCCGGWGACH